MPPSRPFFVAALTASSRRTKLIIPENLFAAQSAREPEPARFWRYRLASVWRVKALIFFGCGAVADFAKKS
jgi:hypothetical protein